jgi:hypothetical protein
MRRLLQIAVAILVLAVVLLPIVLHYAQKAHDQLDVSLADLDGSSSPQAPSGEAFAFVAMSLMEHEIEGTTGWRPNDLFVWGPRLWADNNSNRQLGILQALRETTRVFKDHLTKVSSDVYDQNLVEAETLLRNDAGRWAFPSAESRYREAVNRLRAYIAGLHTDPPTSRPINTRNTEALRLLQAWTDLLGDAHAELFRKNLDWFETDDVFYHAQGYCHVILHMLPAVELEYRRELANRPILHGLFEEARVPLERAAVMKPFIVLNGGDVSLFANHRRNLDAYVNEARQKMYSIREELEK